MYIFAELSGMIMDKYVVLNCYIGNKKSIKLVGKEDKGSQLNCKLYIKLYKF